MYKCSECQRHEHGLYFPHEEGHVYVCRTCQTGPRRALVRELDARATGILRTSGQVPWPYGPNIYVQMRRELLDWAEQGGFKAAPKRSKGYHCPTYLHWLKGQTCDWETYGTKPYFYDHATRWVHKGDPDSRFLLIQPYEGGGEVRTTLDMMEYQDKHGLDIVDHMGPGWYGTGTHAYTVHAA